MKLEFTVWQFVRLMVELESRPRQKGPRARQTFQARYASLWDDLDKDLNNFAMRLKEWYGWHFPELSKILTDSLVYAKAVKLMGTRNKAKDTDFSVIGVPEEMEAEVRMNDF